MNTVKAFFAVNRSPLIQYMARRRSNKILKRLAPHVKRLMAPDEEPQAHCLLVRFAYDLMWVDMLNPLFAMLAHIIRSCTIEKKLVLATDKRLLIFKLTVRSRYAREAYEILYSSIKTVTLWAPVLLPSQKLSLKLKDNTGYVLETVKQYPLDRIYAAVSKRIESATADEPQYNAAYHRRCAACGAVYNRSDAACPLCGFKNRSPAIAGILSFVIPGLGQLYLGRAVLGAVFMAYHVLIFCFVYVYVIQWIGRWHEIAYLVLIQMVIHMINSAVNACIHTHESNVLGGAR